MRVARRLSCCCVCVPLCVCVWPVGHIVPRARRERAAAYAVEAADLYLAGLYSMPELDENEQQPHDVTPLLFRRRALFLPCRSRNGLVAAVWRLFRPCLASWRLCVS